MSDPKPRPRLPIAQLGPLLPLLAGVCVLLGLWLALTGWHQWQDARRSETLQRARDLAGQSIQRALREQSARLRERLAAPAVQSALASGDLAGAAVQLKADWPHVEKVEVLAPDLDASYATLPQAGYGRLAVIEAALAANAPVARIAKVGSPQLVLAAPAPAVGQLVGVAVVQLPVAIVTTPVQSVTVDDDTYLALRQGNANVIERGDSTLASGAE
jgi:phosphomannomutase/phosphoglucomutase